MSEVPLYACETGGEGLLTPKAPPLTPNPHTLKLLTQASSRYSCETGSQGYLARKKQRQPRTLQ